MIAQAIASLLGGVLNATPENPRFDLNDPKAWDGILSGSKAASGILVNHQNALGVAAVWQAVAMISGDGAMLPFHVYKRLERNFREVATEHEADRLISRKPNREMWANELWRRHFVHALLWTNSYIWVHRVGRAESGELLGLYNLLPDRTKPKRAKDGELYYVTEMEGTLAPLAAHEVVHTKGVSIDNDIACDLVDKARDAFGLALAAEGFASKFFANGAGTGGILEIPVSFTENASKNLEEGFRNRTGEENWFKTAILRDGAKFHATTIKPRDSQLNEVSESQVRQVARFFNIPPFKLGLSDSQSYNSSEQAQLVYLTGCLRHWLEAVVGSCSLRLLSEDEIDSGSHFLAHNTSALLETDVQTLNAVLGQQRTLGIINANDYRAKLNMSPRTDPEADSYENPNTSTAAPSDPPPDEDEETDEPTDAQRNLVRHTLSKFGRRVSKELTNEARWEEGEKRFRLYFRDDLRPVADAVSRDGESLCQRMEAQFFDGVAKLLRPDNTIDRAEALEKLFPAAIAARLGA